MPFPNTRTSAPAAPATDTPAPFLGLLVAAVLAALVPTVWMSLDVRAASLFSGPAPTLASAHWWWVELINDWAPAAFRGMLLAALVGWLVLVVKKRQRALQMGLAFVVLAGVLGPGAVVNLVFKDQWQRARPYQVQEFGGPQQFTRAAVMTDQCDNNCSFVSGHVACGVFLASIALVHRRRQVAWTVAGAVAGLGIGFCRMSDSAHWLSDVLWAFPITLGTSWLVWQVLLRVYGLPASKPSRTVG